MSFQDKSLGNIKHNRDRTYIDQVHILMMWFIKNVILYNSHFKVQISDCLNGQIYSENVGKNYKHTENDHSMIIKNVI